MGVFSRLVQMKIAEFAHGVIHEYHKLDKKLNDADESVSGFITDFEHPDLLDGEILAKRPFGFSSGRIHFHKTFEECNEWCNNGSVT
jgi:hypothetical protein